MRSPVMSNREHVAAAYTDTYHDLVGGLNRAERRTVQGRLLVEQAKVAALQAQLDVLQMLAEFPDEQA